MDDSTKRVMFSSALGTWETPIGLFNKLDKEFSFDLDAAASSSNALCERYLTAEDDALEVPWKGRSVWVNPPYGRGVEKWCAKGAREVGRRLDKGEVGPNTVVMLLPARTDTRYFHEWCARGEVRLLPGRLKFLKAGTLLDPAPFPSMVVIWRRVRDSMRPMPSPSNHPPHIRVWDWREPR